METKMLATLLTLVLIPQQAKKFYLWANIYAVLCINYQELRSVDVSAVFLSEGHVF